MKEELTNKEEDTLLEAGREIDYEKREHTMFHDWFVKNIEQLREDFCDKKESAFYQFCKDKFIEWRNTKWE